MLTQYEGEQSPRAPLKSVARKVGFANNLLVMTCADNTSHSSDARYSVYRITYIVGWREGARAVGECEGANAMGKLEGARAVGRREGRGP